MLDIVNGFKSEDNFQTFDSFSTARRHSAKRNQLNLKLISDNLFELFKLLSLDRLRDNTNVYCS